MEHHIEWARTEDARGKHEDNLSYKELRYTDFGEVNYIIFERFQLPGHFMSSQNVATDPEKVAVIRDGVRPTILSKF